MSLQAIWVIATPTFEQKGNEGRLLFTRLYPTFIKKSKGQESDSYVPIPKHQELVKAVLFELGYTKDGLSKFVGSRDSCERTDQKPVYEISTDAGKLWPLVVVEQFREDLQQCQGGLQQCQGDLHSISQVSRLDKYGLIFCCLPSVPQGTHPRPPLINIPGVTLGFTLMLALADLVRGLTSAEIDEKTGEIYSFLTQAAPFGTIVDTTVFSVIDKMFNKPSPIPKTQKQPAWKPVLHKGKNSMHLCVTELVKAVQYDRENLDDVWDIYGTVTCKAELEGTMPEVTLTISQVSEGEVTPLDHLITHPCVQSADADIIDEGRDRAIPRRIRFAPPSEMFTLCHYTVSRVKKLPITGSFEMFLEDKTAKLNVRLKLQDRTKNNFDYCELQVPFHNRGPIAVLDSSVNHGTLLLSPDKNVLVWNVGQKFPGKSSEISISAVIQLGETKQTGSIEDKFCAGQNAYAQLYFKIPDFTHSGCVIDPKSIQVSPAMKYKLTTVREFQSVEYKFWNVHGDAIVSAIPKYLHDQQTSVDDEEEEESLH